METEISLVAQALTGKEKGNPIEPTRHRITSSELFRVGREVVIEHGGEKYRLRLTRQDKLILTK